MNGKVLTEADIRTDPKHGEPNLSGVARARSPPLRPANGAAMAPCVQFLEPTRWNPSACQTTVLHIG